MAKKRLEENSSLLRFNKIKPLTNSAFSLVFIILGILSIIPFIFVIIISFSSEQSIQKNGFSFFPSEWSLYTYQYLWQTKNDILNSFMVSVLVTVLGTILGILLISTMGYVLSRKSFRFHKAYTMITFIPMLFNGGMVATYMIMTQVYGLKNNLFALILPLACSSFYIIVMRTFFNTTIPDSVIESGKIDGASQLRIFFKIVLPISLPAIATIGLFLTFAYWNDWYQSMLYITVRSKFPLQYLLVSIERSVDFLSRAEEFISTTSNTLPSETVRMAIVVVSVLPIALSYPFFQKYFVSGLTVGAVKG